MIQKFEFRETEINGLFEIIPSFNADDICYCSTKDYSSEIFEQNGIYHNLAEVFYSTSKRGIIRGLHFQRVKESQVSALHFWAYFRCCCGSRVNSPTFKKWLEFNLNNENRREILVPAGCAHGFLALDLATISYKCSLCFDAEYDDGIKWDDPDIGIDWHLESIGGTDKVILSEKDENLQSFKEFMSKYGGF